MVEMCLQTLLEVYQKLDKCLEYIPLSRNEFYLTTLRGRWCFLPALPWIEVSRIGSSMYRCSNTMAQLLPSFCLLTDS